MARYADEARNPGSESTREDRRLSQRMQKKSRHLFRPRAAIVKLAFTMISALSIFRRYSSSRPRRAAGEDATDTELALAARVQDRDGKESFVEIVRRHQTAVCAVAYSITGRIGLVDDIAQETFLKAWKRMATLREPAKLKAWLTKIAHDCAVDALRREKLHPSLDEETVSLTEDAGASPDKAAADAEEEQLVWSALAELPENVRTPLVLFYREGQSVAAVAAALDLSEDAVKQRLSRGRHALRAQVTAKIEGVLRRVRPSPLLVVTIASAIGLAAAPDAVAAGVVSSSSSVWLAAAAALAVGVPLGWSLRQPAVADTVSPLRPRRCHPIPWQSLPTARCCGNGGGCMEFTVVMQRPCRRCMRPSSR